MSRSRIFLFLMLCFIGGVALRSFVFIENFYIFLVCGILAVVVVSFGRDIKTLMYGALVLAGMFGMFWYGTFEPHELMLERSVGEKMEIEGVIVRDPESKNGMQQIVVAPRSTSGEYILVSVARYPEFAYGDTVRVSGTLKKPETFDTFNYAAYLAKDDIYFVMRYGTAELIAEGSGIRRALFAFKKQFEYNIGSAMAFPHSAFVSGMLLGSTDEFPKELNEAFRVTGVSHLTALSGYNITVIIVFVSFLLSFLFPSSVMITILSVCAIAVFVLMTGASPSAVRAALMGSALLLAREFGRLGNPIRILICAASIMIFINPRILVFDVGFQLSFLAVLGLAYISPYLMEKMKRVPEFLKLKESLVTTVSAQVAVLPLIAYQFHQVSVVAPLTNVLVLPLVPFAMLFGFLTGASGFVSMRMAEVFAYPLWAITAYQLGVIEYFSHFSFSSLSF